MNNPLRQDTRNCQRRSCLKWEANGELSALDQAHLIELLMQEDPELQQENQCELSCDPTTDQDAHRPLYKRGHGY